MSELCQNPSKRGPRRSVLSEEQTPQVIVFSGKLSEKAERLGRRLPSRAVELSFGRSPGCIVENMRVASVRAARRKLVKLFKKPKSKFYWYDFTVRGRRYRASAQETKSVRALNIASLKLASVIQNTDPPPSKPVALGDFAGRFLGRVDTARDTAMIGLKRGTNGPLRLQIPKLQRLTIRLVFGFRPAG